MFDLRPMEEGTTPADVYAFADALDRLIEIRRALAELQARVAQSKGTGEQAPTELEESCQRIAERVTEIVGSRPRGTGPGNN